MGRHGVAWQIGGTAGEGLESGGAVFAQALAACGLQPTTQRDFPSRIRGGDTTCTVRVTPEGRLAPPDRIDLGLAFNGTVLPRMDARMAEDGLLLLDSTVPDLVPASGCRVARLAFSELAKEAGSVRAKNMVALGASAWLMGLDLQVLDRAVARRFAGKGEDVVAMNGDALQAGYEAARTGFADVRFPLPEAVAHEALLLTGNEAACLGALAAGCRVAAAYPITPASDILEFLTPRLVELGGHAVQVEDEMAALNLCVGAGFAGARALTATSGPGLSLMTESIGLAASTETPVVVLDCQRPGPSTGMPTKHGQEDLWQMVFGGHGEAVRVVLAPTNVRDAYLTTVEAFRVAQRWRCPVFVALDQQCSLFQQTVAPFTLHEEPSVKRPSVQGDAWDGGVQPYGDAGDAPVPPPLPGTPGRWYANSTEHGPSGFTTEDPKVRSAMVARRRKRMAAIVDDVQDPVVMEGPEDARTVLVSWGSTVEACREARDRDPGLRVVAVRLLWPFPTVAVQAAIGDAEVVVVEANGFGQFARLLRSELPVHDRMRMVLRDDGTPVRSTDILEALA